MRAHRLTLAAVLTGLTLFVSVPAYAQNGRFGVDSDMIGLTLTMSQDEVRKLVAQNYPGAVISELPIILTVGGFQRKAAAGFIADLSSKDDNAANQKTAEQQQKDLDARKAAGFGDSQLNRTVGSVGDFAQDRLKILVNPNEDATDIFAIARYTEYARDKQPLTKTVVDALTEKYGPPSRTTGDNRTLLIYTWTGPGAVERKKGSLARCYDDGAYDILYENVGEGGFYGMPQLVNFTSDIFVAAVNQIHSKNPFRNYAGCGTVLQFKLKLAKNGDYVGGMGARLIDLNKAYAELVTFGDDVFRQTSAARQKQMDKDAGIKPKL